MSESISVIVCNYEESISSVSKGARCYVWDANASHGGERVHLLVRSRSGRWIRKWENRNRIGNFRLLKLQPENPVYSKLKGYVDFDGERGLLRLLMLKERPYQNQ